MTQLAQETLEHLRAQQAALAAGNGAPDWLREAREDGLTRFAELGFPTTRQEEWRFTDVSAIRDAVFDLPGKPDTATAIARLGEYDYGLDASARLVFVDGSFRDELSNTDALPREVVCRQLSQAEEPLLMMHASPFGALNRGFLTNGLHLRVKARADVAVPIFLLYLTTGSQPRIMTHPRTVVEVESGARATLVEAYAGLGEALYWTNAATDISLAANAQLDHYRLQEEGSGACHTSCNQAKLERDSVYINHNVCLGGKLTRNDLTVELRDTGIDATVNGLYLGRDEQHVDNHTNVQHVKPHCQSHQVYKGILDNRAAGVFSGRIHVHQAAQQTDARQTNRALLLSDSATINSKPELLIFADDVKCSHGATIGELDRQALYYLRTRGIDLAAARAMLTCAFGGEAIDDMRLEPLRDYLTALMYKRFQR